MKQWKSICPPCGNLNYKWFMDDNPLGECPSCAARRREQNPSIVRTPRPVLKNVPDRVYTQEDFADAPELIYNYSYFEAVKLILLLLQAVFL
jgi:hypothetical protein